MKVTTQGHLLFQLHPLVRDTKGKDSGLLATPNTMDHLPPRSPESTKKLQEGHRKGRTKPSNLREQVDPETMRMYPTPRTGGGSRPNQKGGKVLEEEVMIEAGLRERGKTLKQQMYPTPRATAAMTENLDTVKKRVQKRGKLGAKLEETVAMMYPTPRACDLEGGVVKNVDLRNGSFSRKNKKGVRYGVKLKDAVHHLEKMYPTPAARDWKDSTLSPASMSRNSDSLPTMMMRQEQYPTPQAADWKNMDTAKQKMLSNSLPKKTGGKLNPNFVEFLMGFPMNWTKVESEESKD